MERWMRKIVPTILACGCCAGSRCCSAEADAKGQARADALRAAGTFSSEGFKIRDGHWCSTLSTEEPRVLQVNLFAGNQYRFVAAAVPRARRIAVGVFDEKGNAVATEPYENAAQAAAGFAPRVSGPYYVRVEELEGGPSIFCLIYSYK